MMQELSLVPLRSTIVDKVIKHDPQVLRLLVIAHQCIHLNLIQMKRDRDGVSILPTNTAAVIKLLIKGLRVCEPYFKSLLHIIYYLSFTGAKVIKKNELNKKNTNFFFHRYKKIASTNTPQCR